jgi:hypothetical protein
MNGLKNGNKIEKSDFNKSEKRRFGFTSLQKIDTGISQTSKIRLGEFGINYQRYLQILPLTITLQQYNQYYF